MAQGHYNYSWTIHSGGTKFNAATDIIRIDSYNGYLGANDTSIQEASINTIGMTDFQGNAYSNFPELGWTDVPDGNIIPWSAARDGADVHAFVLPILPAGHSFKREIILNNGQVTYKLTDLTSGAPTLTFTTSCNQSGYPDVFIQFEWWNPSNLGPFKTAFSCTSSNWAVSTDHGVTYTPVSSRAGVKFSDPQWNGTYDVSGCIVSFTSNPVPTPTPTPTPTPDPTPNQCNPPPAGGGTVPGPSPGPTPVPGAANDSFGIKKIYQTVAGGQEWFVSASGNDSRSSPPNHSGSGGASGFKVQSTQVRWGAFTSSGYNEGSCVLNQATLMSRGYMQSLTDWKNVEITAHFRYNHGTGSSDNGGEHIELMARGGEHHDGNGCLGTALHSNSYPNGRAKFEKELEHTAGYTTNDPQTTVGSNAWTTGSWFGLKACIYNTGSNVKLEQYVDKSVNNNWIKVLEFTDTGSWGGGSPSCGGSASTKITWGGPIAFFRWDNIDNMDIRFMSVREINPTQQATAAITAGFDNQPPFVVSTTPADGTNNVAIGSNFTIVMSEALTPTSVNEQNVKLLDDSWNDVPSTITLEVDNKTITIDPISNLTNGKLYTIRLPQDGVSDLNANTINYEYNSVFATPNIILRTVSDTITLSESISRTITPGGSLGVIVYDLLGTSHHTDVTTDGTDLIRVGMLVGSGAAVVGKALTRIIVRLRTGGTSPTGHFQVGIRKADNSFIQFGATIDVTTLPDDSTDRDYTFDKITNFYPLAVGDRVTVETTDIAGGTLSVKKHQSGGIANLTMQDYNGSSWSNESSGYQFAGTWYDQGS